MSQTYEDGRGALRVFQKRALANLSTPTNILIQCCLPQNRWRQPKHDGENANGSSHVVASVVECWVAAVDLFEPSIDAGLVFMLVL
jgi:hypothetical protein